MSPAAAVDISASATWMDNGEKTRLLPVAAVSAEMRLRRRAASAACPAWQVLVGGFLLALPRRHGLVDLLGFDVRKTLRELRRYV